MTSLPYRAFPLCSTSPDVVASDKKKKSKSTREQAGKNTKMSCDAKRRHKLPFIGLEGFALTQQTLHSYSDTCRRE